VPCCIKSSGVIELDETYILRNLSFELTGVADRLQIYIKWENRRN
jgi:hypothetical protein